MPLTHGMFLMFTIHTRKPTIGNNDNVTQQSFTILHNRYVSRHKATETHGPSYDFQDQVLCDQLGKLCATYASFYPRDTMLAQSLQQQRVCPYVRLSICHTPVLCIAERKQDREMYTV